MNDKLMEQKLRTAVLHGTKIVVNHGLGKWYMGLQNSRKALADCNPHLKRIRYSKHFLIIATKEQLEGVTLHEIAHALVGGKHKHDEVFRQKCLEMGAGDAYLGPVTWGVRGIQKYLLTCPECGSISRSNVRKSYICSSCSKLGKQVEFIFTENIPKIVMW